MPARAIISFPAVGRQILGERQAEAPLLNEIVDRLVDSKTAALSPLAVVSKNAELRQSWFSLFGIDTAQAISAHIGIKVQSDTRQPDCSQPRIK